MGKRERAKGARGELELAKKLEQVLGCSARRGQQFAGTPDSPDVKTSIAGIHFESKRTERFSLYASLEQAARDAGADDVPVVATRRNRGQWVVCLALEDLPRLVEAITAHKKGATPPQGRPGSPHTTPKE